MEISIKDLVHLIARSTRFDGQIVWDTCKTDGQSRRRLDARRAEREFGLGTQTSFDEGRQRTLEWQKGERVET